MNELVGIVKKIVYALRERPHGANGPHEHPAYVIVNFPDCMILEEEELIDDCGMCQAKDRQGQCLIN